jgi:hypothetical protein
MYILWKKILRSQGYIKRLDFIYYNNIILYISDNTNILSIPPMNTTHTTLKKFGGTELISVTRSLRISPFYYIRVLFNRWHRVVLCTVKNLLGESAEPGNVLFSRTCFFFLNSIETWEDKVHLPQLHTDADFRRKVPVHVSWHTVRWYLRALQQIDTEEVLKRTACAFNLHQAEAGTYAWAKISRRRITEIMVVTVIYYGSWILFNVEYHTC